MTASAARQTSPLIAPESAWRHVASFRIGFRTVRVAVVEPIVSAHDEAYNDLPEMRRAQWLDLLFEVSTQPRDETKQPDGTCFEQLRRINVIARK